MNFCLNHAILSFRLYRLSAGIPTRGERMKGRIKQLKGERFFEDNLDIYVSRATESYNLSQHVHDFVEINYVEEGSGYHYVNDRLIPIKRGDIFLIPIGTSHVFRPSSPEQDEPLVIYNCIFRAQSLHRWKSCFNPQSKLYQAVFQPSKKAKWLHRQDRHDKFMPIIHNMYSEYLRKYDGYETILTSLLIQLLTMFQRFETKPENESAPTNKLEDAVYYIKRHYSKNITVKQVADYSYMSASHFQRLFKRTTGLTFTQYLQNVRIQKCCHLLKTTNKSVHQIANHVGYQDMKFFHSLFRKKTGVTPQQYRRNVQGEQSVGNDIKKHLLSL